MDIYVRQVADARRDLALVSGQLHEVSATQRTARFYRVIDTAISKRNGDRAVGSVIELSGGWVFMRWLHAVPNYITLYASMAQARRSLSDDGRYLLVLDEFMERSTAGPRRSAGSEPLTDRERMVLLALRRGLPTEGIVAALGLSHHTIKNILSILYKKIGPDVHERVSLVILTRDWNLEDASDEVDD